MQATSLYSGDIVNRDRSQLLSIFKLLGLVCMIGVMPPIYWVHWNSEIYGTPFFRAGTRGICVVFAKHGLSVSAIRMITLVTGDD